VRIYQGDADELPLAPERDLYLTLPRGRHGALEARADVPQVPVAPIRRGQALGTLTVRDGSETVATLPLVAIRDIEAGNWLRRSIDQVRLWVR
jgi:D-alanyl-D-alanine carboxypeptidase (penicillin-binding protein 5/6)